MHCTMKAIEHFNPHQREEGDFRFQSQYTLHLNVSIHTNARRMPLIIRGLKEDVNISLRQLEGGDGAVVGSVSGIGTFQSTPPRRW